MGWVAGKRGMKGGVGDGKRSLAWEAINGWGGQSYS